MSCIALEALVHEGQPLGLGLYAKMLLQGYADEEGGFDFYLFDHLSRNFKQRQKDLWWPQQDNFRCDLHFFPKPLLQFLEERCGLKIQDKWLKKAKAEGKPMPLLALKTLYMIFFDSSTRTRNSFETGITQLGGHGIFLSPDKMQISHGENAKDTANVLSRYGDAIAIRHCAHGEGNQYLTEVADDDII